MLLPHRLHINAVYTRRDRVHINSVYAIGDRVHINAVYARGLEYKKSGKVDYVER